MKGDSFAAALDALRQQLAGLAAQLESSEAQLEKALTEIVGFDLEARIEVEPLGGQLSVACAIEVR